MGDIPEEKTSACSKPFIRIKTILRRQKVILLSQITMYCVLQRKSLPPRERPQVLLKEQSAMKTFPIVQKCNKNLYQRSFLGREAALLVDLRASHQILISSF